MAQWAKIKFFHAGRSMLGAPGSVLTATSTASGYDIKEIYNMLETTAWKAASTASPHYISFDGGSAPALYTADCLAIIGHNLGSAGALVGLQYSFDGFATEAVDVFPQFTPPDDKAIFKEFVNPGAKRYWRLALSNMIAPVYLTICLWGNKTELDYTSAGFDPHEQEVKANVSVSETGYILGIHHKYVERSMTLKFEDADSDLYAKVKEWWETSGLKNFFVVWEGANNPDDVFLMRPDSKFNNPLKAGGLYRDITINLKGRKE